MIEITLKLDDADAELLREALRNRGRVMVETAHPLFGWRHVSARWINSQLKEHDHDRASTEPDLTANTEA